MKRLIFILPLVISFIFCHDVYSQNYLPKWNGYIQTRIESDFNNSTDFIIRRAKLWVFGNVPKTDFITYKLQMVYRSFKDESLMFQDAYADFHLKRNGIIRVGRFVPDFLLQRMQPDYKIPVLERATVINSLIINEKQMAREIGIQYTLQNNILPIHFSFGVFNADVDEPEYSKDNFLLYTSRLVYSIINHGKTGLNIGGSLAYRHLDNTSLTTIYDTDSLITGSDFRWGLECQLHLDKFELQGEYVQADINNKKADGWYAIADYSFMKKYQGVLLAEKYNDLDSFDNDNAWYGLGLNYQISGMTKVMADFKTQSSITKQNYLGEIQLQVLFN